MGNRRPVANKPGAKPNRRPADKRAVKPPQQAPIRLNRYLSQAGVCSRREADAIIAAGRVSVNGQVVSEMGVKVRPDRDTVQLDGQPLRREQLDYILLNKPRNTICTLDDPEGRPTVMDCLQGASKQRLYPAGRLDRNTTGLLLFTNDGELAAHLTHPASQVPKLYAVTLEEPISEQDLRKLRGGLILDDGLAVPDRLSIVAETGRRELGLEIHNGRNRIVRRMMEALGYRVAKLDRVGFGPLTKKGLPRGEWRRLSKQEVGFLKMLPRPETAADASSSTP